MKTRELSLGEKQAIFKLRKTNYITNYITFYLADALIQSEVQCSSKSKDSINANKKTLVRAVFHLCSLLSCFNLPLVTQKLWNKDKYSFISSSLHYSKGVAVNTEEKQGGCKYNCNLLNKDFWVKFRRHAWICACSSDATRGRHGECSGWSCAGPSSGIHTEFEVKADPCTLKRRKTCRLLHFCIDHDEFPKLFLLWCITTDRCVKLPRVCIER